MERRASGFLAPHSFENFRMQSEPRRYVSFSGRANKYMLFFLTAHSSRLLHSSSSASSVCGVSSKGTPRLSFPGSSIRVKCENILISLAVRCCLTSSIGTDFDLDWKNFNSIFETSPSLRRLNSITFVKVASHNCFQLAVETTSFNSLMPWVTSLSRWTWRSLTSSVNGNSLGALNLASLRSLLPWPAMYTPQWLS